ncbi:hypothetical protein EI94DRAFT_1716985 [Lactarius quietus]|nr:hypothetical protein EI94DRAFT_1716985 [Lactarius quietus]
MFTSRLVTLVFVFVFAIVGVMAVPVPASYKPRVGLAGAHQGREAAPFEPILAYMKRDGVSESQAYGKRDLDDITVFGRVPQELDEQQVSDFQDIAVKGEGGVITPF